MKLIVRIYYKVYLYLNLIYQIQKEKIEQFLSEFIISA